MSAPLFRTPLRRCHRPVHFLAGSHHSTLPFRKTFSSAKMEPIVAEGINREPLLAQTRALLDQESWALDEERMGVAKTYYFKTYTKCLDFSQVVGIRSKSKNHHSTMTIRSGSVQIHWTTHFPRGLSDKDVQMAKFCDEQARLIGTVDRTDANKCGPVNK